MRTVIELLCNRLDVIDLSEVISPPGMSCLKQVQDKACVAIRSPDIGQSSPFSGMHLGLIAVGGGHQLPSMLVYCQGSSPFLFRTADISRARHYSGPGYKHQKMQESRG